MLLQMLPTAAIYALSLFVPGFLCLRSTGFPKVWSLCCAPIVSTALVGILGEVYASIGVPATPTTIYAPAVCLPLIALIALRQRSRLSSADTEKTVLDGSLSTISANWWVILLFVVVGTMVCNDLFVSELTSIDAVMQRYDVQHHLNGIQAFADARRISSRGVTFFLADADKAVMPFGSPSFYPAVWYGQCALLMQATGISAPIAINVSLTVTLALAYPLGMCAFASVVFGCSRRVVAFAALTCSAFAMFPWCLLIFGPLYPNLVGFCLIPASMTLCMMSLQPGLTTTRRVLAWVVAVAALLGQALLHPNTLISMFVILVPFVAWTIRSQAVERGFGNGKALLAVCVFLLACLVFWVTCYKLPVFATVIDEYWPDYAYPWQEVVNILSQTYTLFFFYEISAQVILGALVVVGFVRAAYDRNVRWLAVSYSLACLICFVCASFANATLKRFIAGFWYTDAMRVAATAIIAAAPLAAYGLDWVFEQVCHVLQSYNERLGRPTHRRLAALVLGLCFIVLNYMPGFNWPGAHAESTNHIGEYRMDGHEYDSNSVKTTFGDYRQLLRDEYAFNAPLDIHERAFLEEVRAIVGDDLVINNPWDGSTLAYGVCGIRTYFRKPNGFGSSMETEQSLAIRTGLCDIAENEAVQQAVHDIGARYVLVMDSTYSTSSYLNLRGDLDEGAYLGISQITPDTPGFTEILAEGSCRLYRID